MDKKRNGLQLPPANIYLFTFLWVVTFSDTKTLKWIHNTWSFLTGQIHFPDLCWIIHSIQALMKAEEPKYSYICYMAWINWWNFNLFLMPPVSHPPWIPPTLELLELQPLVLQYTWAASEDSWITWDDCMFVYWRGSLWSGWRSH